MPVLFVCILIILVMVGFKEQPLHVRFGVFLFLLGALGHFLFGWASCSIIFIAAGIVFIALDLSG